MVRSDPLAPDLYQPDIGRPIRDTRAPFIQNVRALRSNARRLDSGPDGDPVGPNVCTGHPSAVETDCLNGGRTPFVRRDHEDTPKIQLRNSIADSGVSKRPTAILLVSPPGSPTFQHTSISSSSRMARALVKSPVRTSIARTV